MGRGVFVGSTVGVGAFTSSLPTEQPKLPNNIITSNKPGSDLRLIDKFSIPSQLSADSVFKGPLRNNFPRCFPFLTQVRLKSGNLLCYRP